MYCIYIVFFSPFTKHFTKYLRFCSSSIDVQLLFFEGEHAQCWDIFLLHNSIGMQKLLMLKYILCEAQDATVLYYVMLF